MIGKLFILLVVCLAQFANGADMLGLKDHQLALSNLTRVKRSEAKSNYRITPINSCKVQMDDGKIVDLSSLDNVKSPIQDKESEYTYQFNPCSPFTCAEGNTAAVCQVANKQPTLKYTLGDQSTGQFAYDGTALTLTFSASNNRKSIIQCNCASSNELKFIREQPSLTYSFTLDSKCCCPGKCNGKGGSSSMSFGSILCIIFFSVLGAYFIGGIIFMKFVKKRNGAEMIPNVELWQGLPGNIKAGFSFTMGKIRGNNGGYQSV